MGHLNAINISNTGQQLNTVVIRLVNKSQFTTVIVDLLNNFQLIN